MSRGPHVIKASPSWAAVHVLDNKWNLASPIVFLPIHKLAPEFDSIATRNGVTLRAAVTRTPMSWKSCPIQTAIHVSDTDGYLAMSNVLPSRTSGYEYGSTLHLQRSNAKGGSYSDTYFLKTLSDLDSHTHFRLWVNLAMSKSVLPSRTPAPEYDSTRTRDGVTLVMTVPWTPMF